MEAYFVSFSSDDLDVVVCLAAKLDTALALVDLIVLAADGTSLKNSFINFEVDRYGVRSVVK